mgnify:CR=1 FL=1
MEELRKKAAKYDDLMVKFDGMDPKELAKKLKDLQKLQKMMGGSPDDIMRELEALRKKSKDADDLKN